MRTRTVKLNRHLVASTRTTGNGEIARANKNFLNKVRVTEVTLRKQMLESKAKMLGL